MRATYQHGSTTYEVTIASSGEGRYVVTVGEIAFELVASLNGDGTLRVHDGRCERTAIVSRGGGASRSVTVPGLGDATLERVVRGARRERVAGSMASPMPGKLVALRVGVGDEVIAGQVVAVVEAMKMEMPLMAPHAGRVSRVAAAIGEMVDAGVAVVEVEAAS